MSFTVVAVSMATNEIGMATSAGIACVGMMGMHAIPTVGLVGTMGWADLSHPGKAFQLLETGLAAPDVVRRIVDEDAGQARRQFVVADTRGNIAIHSGDSLDDWKGHVSGDGFVVAGNYLTGPEPVQEMARAFEHAEGSLAERLLQTLDLGQRLGADRRGKMSASLMVVKGKQYPPITVRVDYSPADNAVTELIQAYKAFMTKTYPLFPRFDWPDRW